jgi:hypothetical protein
MDTKKPKEKTDEDALLPQTPKPPRARFRPVVRRKMVKGPPEDKMIRQSEEETKSSR